MNRIRNMTFETTSAISRKERWKEYFDKNVHIGVELELTRNISQSEERNVFGVRHTEYHEYQSCDYCNVRNQCGHRDRRTSDADCHKFARKNLIIAIQTDGSLGNSGSEFLLHTGNISTEEFMARLPIRELVSNGYDGTRHGSIHTHLLIPWFKKEMPMIIFENMWNLFRCYFIGMAYLTGTTRRTILRGTGYSTFYSYRNNWQEKLRHNDRDMMWFADRRSEGDKMLDFNIEIRMFDDSVNAKHIALCRILGKWLLIRGAELAEFGRWMFKDDDSWEMKCNTIQSLNAHATMANDEVNHMKTNAKELYLELEHLMTEIEKDCFMTMLRSPIWKGSSSRVDRNALENVVEEGQSELEIMLKTKALTADSRMEYYDEMAKVLNTTSEMVRVKLSKLGATWNRSLGLYSLK